MLKKRISIEYILEKYGNWLFLAAVLLLGLGVRFYLLPFLSVDMERHLLNWMEQVRELGGFAALKTQIGDYTPAYMLLVVVMSYLRYDAIVLIKAISVAGDILLAVSCYLLVYQLTESKKRAMFSAAVIFMLPTVLLNSGAWGQCDAIFTSFLVLFLFFYLRGNKFVSMGCYWIALAFKLQAIFLAPLVVLLFLAGKIKLRHVLAGFSTYFLLFLPSILAGRGISVLWDIYRGQAGNYRGRIVMSIPNLYTWFDRGAELNEPYMSAAVIMGLCVTGIFLYALWVKREHLDTVGVFYAAILFAFLLPHILPKMHDRYFFVADILTVLLACCYFKKFYIALGVQMLSLLSYIRFLYQQQFLINLHFLSAISVFLLVMVAIMVFKYFGVSTQSTMKRKQL